MNSIGILLVLVSSMTILQVVYGAASLQIVTPDPSDPDKCPASGDRPALAIGESKSISGCSEVSCAKWDSGELVVEQISCGLAFIPGDCKKIQDLSKPYPDCCPKIECPATTRKAE